MPKRKTIDNYYGRILNGDYSDRLKSHVAECIRRFRAFDETGSPAIPYISAWQEKHNILWYEFISERFIKLLGCDHKSAAERLRNSIIERHVYRNNNFDSDIKQEVIKQDEMQIQRGGLRQEATTTGTVEAVYKIRGANGETFWLKDQAAIEPFMSGKIYISLGTLTIVTKEMEAEEHLKKVRNELKRSEQKFREQAIRDNLTDLYNTRYLYRALTELIAQSIETQQSFSLVFMDIDNFKQVVDAHGHLNASKTLQEVAATIKAALTGPSYGVAYGGDEFVLVLPGFDRRQGINTAKKLRSRIKESVYLQKEGLNVQISASMGVSTFPQDGKTQSELLALADQAMFSVKAKGKDSVCSISYGTKDKNGSEHKKFFYDCKE
jgi:diguanylate cyclase (GGDEF)-like protein